MATKFDTRQRKAAENLLHVLNGEMCVVHYRKVV